ncbi:Lactonase, 7-bladed beta-propeller [Planctomycetes bacterium Poly30]|uniref:Lactonase, 7-bladed beta-propeller n=1 Tax=Saltatorellus ferox TaxID=2528018 RepID=A0A518ES21_9BACT|nr:Lactonase, 7-bladed beta-propeller [Planctomycetes bacterium Poly30]
MPRDNMTANSLVPRSRPGQTALAATSLLIAASCGAFDSSKNSVEGVSGSGAVLRLNEVSNGFGQLLPHSVLRPGTNEIISIRSLDDIAANVMRGNAILPTVTFPTEAIEPDNTPGNHFIYANFTQVIDPLTVLNPSPTSNGLSGPVSVTTIDAATGSSLSADGRAFVGGKTLVRPAGGGQLELQQWVVLDEPTGQLVPTEQGLENNFQARGFPGLGSAPQNAATLVSDKTILFVADSDANLNSFETFPQGVTIRFRVTTSLVAANGRRLADQVLAATTVGSDELSPELLRTPPPAERPLISPGNGDINVDPETSIRFEFTEPVQPYSVGEVLGQGPPLLSSAIKISFGPATGPTDVPINAVPISPYDLSTYLVRPGFQFPGQGPEFLTCGTFSTVSVSLSTNQIEDLALVEGTEPGQLVPNTNSRGADTDFETGEGPGIVNAPVAPDVIYVGRSGANAGISVLDLNGFGQSTGNPVSSAPFPLEGESRFPYDPNVTQNPTVRPILSPGECTIDGGSAGVFTLTLDSSLSDLLATAPLVSSATDIHFGHALDVTFRNAPPPFGCQAGGGNVCALDGIKIISIGLTSQANTVVPTQANQLGGVSPGYENVISWAPHPNPPGISFPPACVSPFLAGAEPTTVDPQVNPTTGLITPVNNLLAPGNPFPVPANNAPPRGLLTLETNQFFLGPSFGQTNALLCNPYQIRQQVGHFLYVADRPRNEVVVFNSNRMLVVARIPVADPTSFAMGPNIDILAVSNQLSDSVTFIDINPASAQFHNVIKQVQVGNSPRGLAFDGMNEDLIVCNELDSSLSIIAASSLLVRRTINSQLNRPFELAVCPRQLTWSFRRAVYFAYILNRTGACAFFESGPNGVNGWGFDDVVGIVSFDFQAPKTIQLDPINLDASVYIVHEGAIDANTGDAGEMGDGAISRLRIESGPFNAVLITQSGFAGGSNLRGVEFGVPLSVSQSAGQLSGIPIDIAFDNQRNVGALLGPRSDFTAGSPLPANNKSQVRVTTQFITNGQQNTFEAQFMFAAVPNPVGASGVIDVLALGQTGTARYDTNPYIAGVQSIDVPQVSVLCDFSRQ